MSHTHEIAWAAGFFDGEGYVNVQKRSHPKYTGYYLRIGINHVAIEPLLEMKRLFGGTVVKSDNVIGNRKPRHRWVTSTSNAADTLKQMLPFMHNKNKVAAIALDFQSTIGKRAVITTPQIQQFRAECKATIQFLNSLD